MRRQINGSGLTVNPVGLEGASPYRIALAWFLHKGPPIIPIPGASKVTSVRDSAEAGSALFRRHLKIVILRSVQATADDEQGLSC